ncbi:MAG: hypothetical protein ACI9TH_003950 [Kiritimatiellia bacterium]|jgi:hypothetical protein
MYNWATQGLNYYLCEKLHWNPELDVDDLIDDYCTSGFGDAAPDVKAYFLRREELTNLVAADEAVRITHPYTPEILRELRAHLLRAAGNVDAVPEHAARVKFLQAGLDYTEAYVAGFRLFRAHEAAGGGRLSKELKQEIRVVVDENWLKYREMFEHHHMAVNVATVAWGSRAYFGRYYWSSPSPEVLENVLGPGKELSARY